MRKKGFTLIELLVVIAIIAMLLAILMPALGKVKRLAQRLVCGASAKGLGTAMMVYAQDFEDRYPVQGGSGDNRWSEHGYTQQWYNPNKDWSKNMFVTVASSLYLLVRNADVDPKSFVCRSGEETAFQGVGGTDNIDIVELWDFGGPEINGTVTYNDGLPKEHVSYAYQLPYPDRATDGPARPASATSSASTAILADKNPWQDSKLKSALSYSLAEKQSDFMMLIDWLSMNWKNPKDDPLRHSTIAWQIQIANSQPHSREGQNVLFGDGHASFEKRSDVSYQNDNIYTMFNINNCGLDGPFSEKCRRAGRNLPVSAPRVMPLSNGGEASYPVTGEDTLLVNDDFRP